MRRVIALVCLASPLALAAASPAVELSEPKASTPAIRLSPESQTRFAVALAAFQGADWDVAAREFGDAAWGATPLANYALLFKARSQLKLGDAAGARATALRVADAADEGKLAPAAVVEIAALLSSAGDDTAAAKLLDHFITRHGDHREVARARLLLGQVLLSVGRTSDAAQAYKDLWLLSPGTSEASAAAGQLKVLAQRGLGGPPPTSRERLERAERLLAAGSGDPAKSEAEALLSEGLAADLRARAFKVVLESHRRAGRGDAALATVNRALSSLPDPSRPPWLLELAQLQQRRSRDLALSAADALVRQYPKAPEAAEALLLKARLLEETGKFAEAEAVYTRAAADRADEDTGATAVWRLGWCAWFRGAYAEAAAAWSRTLGARGGQALREAASYWLARADERRGEQELAARRFSEVQGEAPRSYYGILASRRPSQPLSSRTSATAVALLADPLETLKTDPDYARVEALRAVSLAPFADEEMAELTRGAAGDSQRLYALSAAYAAESRYHLALRILRRHFLSVARSGIGVIPRMFWEMFYPLGWRGELTEAAARAAVDPLLVAAVVREESSFYQHARSRVGARGLMQLMPETARSMAQARRLSWNDGDLLDDPAVNLELGAAYLSGLLREFGDARLAAAAYNAGPNRVREWWRDRRSDDLEVWVEQIPFNETRAFVKRVMLSWDEYRRLYGASGAGAPERPDPR